MTRSGAPRQITADTMGAYRLVFETETCARCGGCGEYSFNMMTGTRCLKCNRTGRQITSKGKNARKRYTDATAELLPVVTAADLAVGDMVRQQGVASFSKWTTVQEIGPVATRSGRLVNGGTADERIVPNRPFRFSSHSGTWNLEDTVKFQKYDAEAIAEATNRALKLSGCWLEQR